MSIDLDINNYNLNDILNLFKIPIDFDEHELKYAKQIVLKTHPDKSKLSPEYFLFYSKAYKMLYSVWEFRKKGDINNNSKNTDYVVNSTEEKNILLDNFFETNKKLKNKTSFNEWFNNEFEKNKLYNENEEKGYGEWLKTDEDIDDIQNVSMATMKLEFERKKSQARSLIVRDEVQEIWGNNFISATELTNEAPLTYDSGLFSGLAYQDLHKAHTETVIPVTDEDYEKKQKFNNVNEFVRYRNNQDIKPLSEIQAQQYLNDRNRLEEEKSVTRAYELAKQTEKAKQNSQDFWSSIQLLHNK